MSLSSSLSEQAIRAVCTNDPVPITMTDDAPDIVLNMLSMAPSHAETDGSLSSCISVRASCTRSGSSANSRVSIQSHARAWFSNDVLSIFILPYRSFTCAMSCQISSPTSMPRGHCLEHARTDWQACTPSAVSMASKGVPRLQCHANR